MWTVFKISSCRGRYIVMISQTIVESCKIQVISYRVKLIEKLRRIFNKHFSQSLFFDKISVLFFKE
jgi:hypothetical protein